MASRRYPTAELYDERERDFYGGNRRTTREYEELDVDLQRGPDYGRDPRRSVPDFLRDDFGHGSAGPLVRRDSPPPMHRPRAREVEKEELIIRDDRREYRKPPLRAKSVEREEIRYRHEDFDDTRSVRSRGTRKEIDDTEISIRREEVEKGRPRRRGPRSEVDDTEISIKHEEIEKGWPRRRGPHVEREVDEISIRREERDDLSSIRTRSPPPFRPREVERDEFTIRRSETERVPARPREFERGERGEISFRRGEVITGPRGPRGREVEKEEISIRREEIDDRRSVRSPRSRSSSRERVSFRETRSRSRPRHIHPHGDLVAREREEFVVRRRRSPSPPPKKEVERTEIVISRKERSLSSSPSRSPSPEPLPPVPPPLEPIVRPPIIQEIITHHRHIDHGVERARSPTPPPLPLPPPPPLVKEKEETMEISIRSKKNGEFHEDNFEIEREEVTRGRREVSVSRERRMSAPPGPQPKPSMWTEITKDLVIREAIEVFGYGYEETTEYFYVMEYLRYEDVLQLVELSDEIRRDRRARIREIEYERDELHRRRGPYDERVVEREVVYDSRTRRH